MHIVGSYPSPSHQFYFQNPAKLCSKASTAPRLSSLVGDTITRATKLQHVAYSHRGKRLQKISSGFNFTGCRFMMKGTIIGRRRGRNLKNPGREREELVVIKESTSTEVLVRVENTEEEVKQVIHRFHRVRFRSE